MEQKQRVVPVAVKPTVADSPATSHDRIVVSHDYRTMPHHYKMRLLAGKRSPGLLVATQKKSTGEVAESIIFLWAAYAPGELEGRVFHLPSLIEHVFVW